MGQIREVDAISDAIIATEREIAGNAWDLEDTDPADETGDRALESMGDGLEGQHELEDEDDAEGSEEQQGGEESEGEEGEEGEAETAEAEDGKTGEGEQPGAKTVEQQHQGRVPSSEHRKLREERDAIRTERDGLKTEIEALRAAGGNKAEIEALKMQVATLTQMLQPGNRQQQIAPAKEEPAEAPDIFENPKGFVDHIQKGVRDELNGVMSTMRSNMVSMSFELAHGKHQGLFDEAMTAINKLDPNNPADRQVVQNIYNSANPGEQLVSWHKRNETFRRVGSDPVAYEERIRNETRQALLNDPEFKKEMLASLRGEAQTGNNGSPRTTTRMPPSLARASGASRAGERVDANASDGSEQAVADAAWR